MEDETTTGYPKMSVMIDQRIKNLESGAKEYFVEELDRDMWKYGQNVQNIIIEMM